MGEWQPIESAPVRALTKSGSRVLLVWGGRVSMGWHGESRRRTGWWLDDYDDYAVDWDYTPIDPTHWMPLPAAPRSGGETNSAGATVDTPEYNIGWDKPVVFHPLITEDPAAHPPEVVRLIEAARGICNVGIYAIREQWQELGAALTPFSETGS